jgi:hypothetical protein
VRFGTSVPGPAPFASTLERYETLNEPFIELACGSHTNR